MAEEAATSVATAVAPRPKRKNKKTKLVRPRGKRGGAKNRPAKAKGKVSAEDKVVQASEHSKRIAKYHSLEKELARTDDDKRRKEILAEQEALGGINAYQNDSLLGSDKTRGGESGKWCAKQLADIVGEGTKLRLLDVGALEGTSYAAFPWIETTSIDINPRSPTVIQGDFFEYSPPSGKAEKFDVVALSLVINFMGDLFHRGEALVRAHDFLVPRGYLYLVLPLACVANSRYLDHDRLKQIIDSCGWEVVINEDSKRLTRWLLQRKEEVSRLPKGAKASKGASQGPRWDGKIWKKEEIKVSTKANNFCIRIGGPKPTE
ncbi:unnamed protein product [Parajaminaea phylloscopi]